MSGLSDEYDAFHAGYTAACHDRDFSDLEVAEAYEKWVRNGR